MARRPVRSGWNRSAGSAGNMHKPRIRRKDGVVRVFEFTVATVDGTALMLTISRDVTERRDAAQRLRASERRLGHHGRVAA